jgi:Flp pilus assembly pilin Flp
MGRFRLCEAIAKERHRERDLYWRGPWIGLFMRITTVVALRLWRHLAALDSQCAGQDLIEYALMAGLIATGIVTMSPAVASAFVDMMSKVNSVVAVAGS